MVKFAVIFRYLKKNISLNVINILSMAMGLTVTGIILSYVYQEYHYDSERINSSGIYRVILHDNDELQPADFGPLAESLKNKFPEIRDAVRVSFFWGYLACSSGKNKFNERIAIFADSGFFNMFSFPLVRGSSSNCLSTPNSIVLSESAAKKYFGDEDPLGRRIQIGNENEFTVTGIFRNFGSNSNFRGDIVLPISIISKLTQIWIEPSWKYGSDIHTFVLLNHKVSVAALSVKARNIISQYIPGSKSEISFEPLSDIHVNRQLGWESAPQANTLYLKVFLAAALLTLSISVANFLFLYIGATEQRATGTWIKNIFGASRFKIFLEHIREVIVLMLMSVVISMFLFYIYNTWLTGYFTFLPRIGLPDYRLTLLLLSVILITALLAGIYPSILLASVKITSMTGYRATTVPGRFHMVSLLVVLQFILCISLVAASITMNKQTHYMENHGTGYAESELISIPLNMHIGEGIYNERFQLFSDELKKYPDIKNVSLSFSSPASVNNDTDGIRWEGMPEGKKMKINWEAISYDYFKTLGVKIIEGRSFSRDFPNDEVNWDKKTCSFIINEKAVKEMGISDPIGKEFEVWAFKGPIVGVVEDYNFKSMHSGIGPMFYQVNPFYLNEILVRFDPVSKSVVQNIRTVWEKFVPDYPLEINYVSDQINTMYRNDRNLAKIMNVFSILSVLIASAGLFTLTVLTMNRRVREIGIRKVIGAGIPDIMKSLVKDYFIWVSIAFVFAVPFSWFSMSRWLDNFAYKTRLDWWIFILSGLGAMAIALFTVTWKCWLAARRNPVETIRYE